MQLNFQDFFLKKKRHKEGRKERKQKKNPWLVTKIAFPACLSPKVNSEKIKKKNDSP